MSFNIAKKAKGFITNPVESFRQSREDKLGDVIKYFAVILTTFATLLIFVVAIVAIGTGVYYETGYFIETIIRFFIVCFIVGFIGLFVGGVPIHLIGIIISDREEGFGQVLKVLIYSSTPAMLLGWIPVVRIVSGLWAIIILILGIRELYRISTARAVIAFFLSAFNAITISIVPLTILATHVVGGDDVLGLRVFIMYTSPLLILFDMGAYIYCKFWRGPPHRDATTPPGKADILVQKKSSLSSKKPDHALVLPDGGSAESTAKPDISITLGHATIHADEWDKIGLTLVNTGTAPAFDITLTFSNDVETRMLRPVDLAAGESITIDAGIKPRTKGKIPLEITARYRDAGNRTYEQTTSCWLSVVSRNDSAGSPLPSSIPHPMTPKSLPPEMAERYIASEYLGRGGFARVFKVQKPDGSWAALKIPISLDAATGKSFIAELQNWTSMVHENIVRVQDYNIMPLPYFEMELCDGTLAELEKPVPPDHAAWLLFNVCEGLKYAHARGILHRDLKPQNIMLRDGVPKISDWGLSRVMTQSRTTTVSGGFTAYYAAPEQIANRVKGPRTDIWQLGVILYELVTGQLPFTGESMVEIGMAIVTKTPERPGAVHSGAQPLDAIILRCLEKQPRQRYRSVADLQSDLAAYLKMNYAESLKESIQVNDLHRSAYYCGDLVLISMKTGNLVDAYKYAADLARYSAGEARAQAIELAKQIKMRVEMGAQELPDELIRKAEVIVHQVRVR